MIVEFKHKPLIQIRTILRTLNLLILIIVTALLVQFTSLDTSPYPTRDTTALSKWSESIFNPSPPSSALVINNITAYEEADYQADASVTNNYPQILQIGYPAFPAEVGVISAGVVSGVLLTLLVVLMLGVVQSWVHQPNHRVKKFSGKFWDQCLVGVGVLFSGLPLQLQLQLQSQLQSQLELLKVHNQGPCQLFKIPFYGL